MFGLNLFMKIFFTLLMEERIHTHMKTNFWNVLRSLVAQYAVFRQLPEL